MPHSVLITQCMQRDFIDPLGAHDPLPNALHVGREEAQRLLGADPERGPLAALMGWARAQADGDLTVLHIRDWHDRDDPAQRAHLERFGEHCIQGTRGAELVLGLDPGVSTRGDERFIDSISLNDFEGTSLAEVLGELRGASPDGELRVGVVGVWTEAKITFLLYDLVTRGWATDVATCSALCASASRAQHFNALEQLKKLLGVRVFDSVGAFCDWSLPEGARAGALAAPSATARYCPELRGDSEALSEEDRAVIALLYRDSARLELKALSGGFSGASVFRAQSWDALGHEQSASVLKLGTRELIGDERVAFERVESILGNDAPTLRGFADVSARAGIKYAYAAMGRGDSVRTFKSLYESGLEDARIEAILDEVFSDILGRFYSAAQYERLGLLDYYTFEPRHGAGVRGKVAELMGEEQAGRATVTWPGGFSAPNPADFYEVELPRLPRPAGEYHFVSYVHGDLNGANVLLDGRDNVWLIDFFHAHRGHLLRDLAKFENDLLYLFTPVDGEEALAQALEITRALERVEDLRAGLPEAAPDGVTRPELVRAWRTLRVLRGHVARVCRSERGPVGLHTALLRYSAHTLWFDEANEWQRRWALAGTASHARRIVRRFTEDRKLRVGWVDSADGGRLGVTICPGRRDRGRDLEEDLGVLEGEGVSMLVGCMTRPEMEWAGVEDIAARAEARGMTYVHVPAMDQSVPGRDEMGALVGRVREALGRGERVVAHCMGGLGRSGTAAACVLVEQGASAGEALAAVRAVRGPRAIESAEQERFVAAWARQER